MEKFWDERGYVVTRRELYEDYINISPEERREMTFEQYITNCCSGNGTLTWIKED